MRAAEEVSDVSLGSGAFNPAAGEKIVLKYTLSATDNVTVSIFDPDGGLVRTLAEASERQAGPCSESWDGKDLDGKPVPNEAYTFTIETASGSVYDPTTFSGGVVGDITQADFSREAGTVVYRLPQAARVLMRLGIRSGPMLKTLVDWQPRITGSITEYWDGRDEDKLIAMRGSKDFTALITYVTLPEATVIAYGNDKETYREYKLGRAQNRPQKPERPFQAKSTPGLRPKGLVPPAWERSPKITMQFPDLEKAVEGKAKSAAGAGVPEVPEKVRVRIDADPADKQALQRGQFEIIFYVDNLFFAEAERGFLPLTWEWELSQFPAGEHVLTANVSSFQGQVGVASRKVKLVKADAKEAPGEAKGVPGEAEKAKTPGKVRSVLAR